MSAHRVRTIAEMAEIMRHGPPPTPDDVSITREGERLDTPEKVRAWVARMNVERAAEDRQRQQHGVDA